METLFSMPLPMALSLMVVSAIAIYTFLNLLSSLEESFRPVGRQLARQSENSSRIVTQ